MPRAVTVSVDGGLATVRIAREHGNAINDTLVDELMTAFQEAEAAKEVRGAMLAASGKLFSPGLDLQELIELDRPTMEQFLHRFNSAILVLYTFSKPMVAAIHSHAIAGGCVLALTADWRVLRRGATVGLNELRAGVPFPFGVSMILRQTIPTATVEEVALFGKNYSDEAAVEAGVVHELHDESGFEEHCRGKLEELADRDPQAFAITKRYLRSATVERIRANDPHFAGDFLDSWFSPPTQERIRAIVAGLQKDS